MTQIGKPQCRIQLLDGIEITRNGELLYDQRKHWLKTYKVLSYLLLRRGRPMTSIELMRVLGYDTQSDSSKASLKVLIHRIRKRLSEEATGEKSCIVSTTMGYAWNMDCGIRVDLFEAEALCESAMRAQQLSDLSESEIEGLMDVCGRELLPIMDDDTWVVAARTQFWIQHTTAVQHVLRLMWQEGDAERIIRMCHRGLTNDPMHVPLRRYLTRASKMLAQRDEVEINASG